MSILFHNYTILHPTQYSMSKIHNIPYVNYTILHMQTSPYTIPNMQTTPYSILHVQTRLCSMSGVYGTKNQDESFFQAKLHSQIWKIWNSLRWPKGGKRRQKGSRDNFQDSQRIYSRGGWGVALTFTRFTALNLNLNLLPAKNQKRTFFALRFKTQFSRRQEKGKPRDHF